LQNEIAEGADPEDPDEYRAINIFWVPPEARWSHLQSMAKQPTIGQIVDDAMLGIERDNPSLKGVLPKEYAHPGLDKTRLGQIIGLVNNIELGYKANRSKDILGRVDKIRLHGHVLITGSYVGAEVVEENNEQFEQEMRCPVVQLQEQTAQACDLDDAIAQNLKELGYDLSQQ
jgi:hypothetical protein